MFWTGVTVTMTSWAKARPWVVWRVSLALTTAKVFWITNVSSTTYVESAAGVAVGGRTGLTAIVIAVCFAFALFLSPLFLAIPMAATGPALIIVGVMMISNTAAIEWDDYSEAIPAFLCITLMPFTYSISNGILIGLLSYVVLNLFSGKSRKITPVMYVLAVLIILKYLFV